MHPELETEKVDGDGKPIVFVHGWIGSIESWRMVRSALDIENPMIFYSQRCHGESDCSSFTIESLAEDLKQITENLEDPIIAGHSMGGMTALKYSTISENYSKLILLGTCASTPRPEHRSPSFFLEQLDRMDREKWAEMIADNYAEESPRFREATVDELVEANKEPLRYGLEAMIEYDLRKQLKSEEAMVVGGKRDGAIPEEQIKELAELLECRKIMIDSSHLMLQEKPVEIAEIIEDFVRNQ